MLFTDSSPAWERSPHRSICTGAIFVGAAGGFDGGLLCTTHWAAYAELARVVAQAAAAASATAAIASSSSNTAGVVVAARFVDAGPNGRGTRVVSSGGISCGMDACLHVVRLRASEDEAVATAALLDYAWRKTEGVVVHSPLSS